MAKDFNTNTVNEQTWLTPPGLVKSLGPFDLDPCTPMVRYWDTAAKHYTRLDNGLTSPWEGRVWLNPPYGDQLGLWLNKMTLHRNGTALVFARTETDAIQRRVFPLAYSILFIAGRIRFYTKEGKEGQPANAPSMLIAYTERDAEAIEQSRHKYAQGFHWYLNGGQVHIIEINKTWRAVIGQAMVELGGVATLQEMYELVYAMAPKKCKRNIHYKAKVRQVLQLNFERINKGKYRA